MDIQDSGDLYVVWYGGKQGWRPSKPMAHQHAELYAESLRHEGYETRIHPRMRVTRDDWLEE